MRELLARYGKEGDNCMYTVLEYLHQLRGIWMNKDQIAEQRFAYTEKGRVKYFSADTISRKARNLAELGLLARKQVNHRTFYAWPEGLEVPKRQEYKIEFIDGKRVAIPIIA